MNDKTLTCRGELALVFAVLINSFGVVLMLYSVGTKEALLVSFQGALVLTLMILRKKFIPQYLFSFVVGFFFGEFLDLHEMWINILPTSLSCRILYFIISYVLLSLGIALSNRCKMPIVPTDLFPRELADITKIPYSRIKITFDVICLLVTACMTGFLLGHIKGLGIGTVLAAFTMGKAVSLMGNLLDKKFRFVSFMKQPS